VNWHRHFATALWSALDSAAVAKSNKRRLSHAGDDKGHYNHPAKRLAMNSDLRQFVTQTLSLVLGTLMLTGFFAFVTIPYSLGGHPGDAISSQASKPVPTQVAVTQRQDEALQRTPLAVRL
jgi:hypothetical protein